MFYLYRLRYENDLKPESSYVLYVLWDKWELFVLMSVFWKIKTRKLQKLKVLLLLNGKTAL